jgi:hypothetical protein
MAENAWRETRVPRDLAGRADVRIVGHAWSSGLAVVVRRR